MNADRELEYRPDIDGLRAVAVLLVVFFHGFPASVAGGFVGVDIFLVISGFLISGIILRRLEQQRFSFRDFYLRRVRRIYPALILVLVASLAFGWLALLSQEYALLGEHVAGGAAFIANFQSWQEAGYFNTRQDLKPLLHLWSLAVEEQYYLIWPAMLALLWTRVRWLPLCVCLLLLASFALNVALVRSSPSATFYLLHTRFWELLLGSILAFAVFRRGKASPEQGALHALRAWSQPATEIAACAGLLLLCLAAVCINPSRLFPGWWALLPCVGTVLLIAAGPRTFVNRRLLSARPLVMIGLISYPLYLWHWPLLAFARILNPAEPAPLIKGSLILASFVLAWLTYRWVERPIRSNRTARPALVLFATCAAVGMIGLGLHSQGGIAGRSVNRSHGAGPGLVAEEIRQKDLILSAQKWEQCAGLETNRTAWNLCSVSGDADGTPIVLWGDSHAKAWAPVFYRIAQEHKLRLFVFSYGACPPIIEVRKQDSDEGAGRPCSQFGTAESVIAAVRAIRPVHLFVIGYWGLYTHGTNWEIAGQPAGLSATEQHAALHSRLVQTLLRASAVSPVTVFRAMPTLPYDAERAVARGFPLNLTAQTHRAFEAGLDSAIDEAIARAKNITVFDPAAITCRESCSAVMHGTLLYSDHNHVSVAGSLLFREALLQSCFEFLPLAATASE